MRKTILILTIILSAMAANAIPLFPFFVDVAGDYHDGTLPELEEVGVECGYSKKSFWFSTLSDAENFLNDVLPTSNYPIERREMEKDGTKIVTYTSPMGDNQLSILFLVEIPQKGLFTGYSEIETTATSRGGYFD